MRKIVRPDSTSYVIESIFHYCKSKTETENVLNGKTVDDIVVYSRYVDTESFQPNVVYLIKDNTVPMYHWQKYISDENDYKEVLGITNKVP